MVQVTSVPLDVGDSWSRTVLDACHGWRKRRSMSTASGASPVISMLPSPALRLPFQV